MTRDEIEKNIADWRARMKSLESDDATDGDVYAANQLADTIVQSAEKAGIGLESLLPNADERELLESCADAHTGAPGDERWYDDPFFDDGDGR